MRRFYNHAKHGAYVIITIDAKLCFLGSIRMEGLEFLSGAPRGSAPRIANNGAYPLLWLMQGVRRSSIELLTELRCGYLSQSNH